MTILVATDFSPCSATAVHLATAVAQRQKAPIFLVHALESSPMDVPMLPIGLTPGEGSLMIGAELAIEREADEIRKRGVAVRTAVLLGPAATVVLQAAREQRADLIVVGTHGRTGASRLLMGSVAEGVVRSAGCPVLIANARVADRQDWRLQTILVASDLSGGSKPAVAAAYGLLQPGGGHVQLCHVHALNPVGGVAEIPVELPLNAEERFAVGAQLRGLIPRTAEASGITTRISVVEGRFAAEAILTEAQRLDVDAIAVGSHGRSGLRRALLGSVAEDITRSSQRPILIVRSRAV